MSVLAALKRVNAPPPPEESVALRVAVLIAVVAAEVAVLTEGVGGPVIRVASLVGVPAGFALSHWHRHRQAFWLKVVLAAGLMLAFFRFLATVTHVSANSLADVQIPLAELFLWVQLLHSFDVPARRDLLFSLVSSLTLMAVAGVLSVSLGFARELGVWAVAAVTALVLGYRRELASWPPLAAEARPRPTRTLGVVVASLVTVLMLGVGVFLVAPAAGTSRAFTFPSKLLEKIGVPQPGGLANPTLGDGDPSRSGTTGEGRQSFGYFGFSDRLDTSVRGRPDGTLVMRVRAAEPDFWRGQTFDHWDGRSWTLSDDRPHEVRDRAPLQLPAIDGDLPEGEGSELIQTFYLETPTPNLVFGAYSPRELYFPDNAVFQLSDGTVRAGLQMDKGTVYTVVSRRPIATPATLRASEGLVGSGFLARYTQLPDVSPRVRQLALDVAGSAPTTYDQVLALQDWLAQHTTYSLDVPPLPDGADAVDQFLFVDRVGFCEQIGTSLTVMLRSLGVPARLAVGYAPGERNPFTGMFEVRASDAHAWVEVYFPGLGWQGFDPTARVPLAGDPTPSAGTGFFAYLGRHLPHPPVALIVGVAVAVALAALSAGAVALRAFWRRRRRPATWAGRGVVRLERLGARRGRPRRAEETVAEYASALRCSVVPDPRLARVAAALDAAAYGLAPPDPETEAVLTELARGQRANLR